MADHALFLLLAMLCTTAYAIFLKPGGTEPLLDGITAKCEPFNANSYCGRKHGFEIKRDCVQSCECELPPDAGNKGRGPTACKTETRYYFDQITDVCYQFKYLGCGGNGNNFKIRSECNSQCNPRDLGSNDMYHMLNLMQRMNSFGSRFNQPNGYGPPPFQYNFGQPRNNRFGRPNQQKKSWPGRRQNNNNFRRHQQNRKPYNPLKSMLPHGRW